MVDQKALCYGMQYDLEQLIDSHLFVLCPNNSGSTFLKNALSYSEHTWNLKREGQNTFGYVGPNPRLSNRQLIWASNSGWMQRYNSPANFNWAATKRAWYAQAFSTSPQATVFVEKSPPFILISNQLREEFLNSRFLIMVRNPYAMYEGIIRRRIENPIDESADMRVLAARHIVACLKCQQENIENLKDANLAFTYEQLCESPSLIAGRIADLVAQLSDMILDRKISVKGLYDEPLRNMNSEQIGRLSDEDVAIANGVFKANIEYLDYFNYELIGTA